MPVEHPQNRRIAMLTYGSRGDVEPFVALGVGLQNAGHSVCLVGPAPFAAFVERHGLEFTPIEGNPEQLAQVFADRAGMNWFRMVEGMARHVLPLARTAYRTVEQATRRADLIIHSFLMTDAGHTLARMQAVPDLSAQFFPVFLPTAAFVAVALPDLPLGAWYRRGTHTLNTAMFRYGARLLYRRLLVSAPELPALAPWPFSGPLPERTPVLLAYSSHILPPPPDWPPYAHITGFWQLQPPLDWRPADDLVHFLDSGAPPIYFGLGSMRTDRSRSLLRMAVVAARDCGQRMVLGAPPQEIEDDLRGADVFAIEGVPHAWLFPRMRYILHHGGAGTTGAAAAAGVPSTAIPVSADQAFWARRIHHLGLGPAAPSARRLTRGKLEALIRAALADPACQQRAALLGEKLRQEDGVAAAMQIIHKMLK